MITVSEDSITQAEMFFDELTEQDARNIGEQFATEQPYLFTFVQAMAAIETDEDDPDELLDSPLAQDLAYYAMFIWKTFELEAGKIAMIEEKEIDEQSDASMTEMQNLLQIAEGGDPALIAKQFEKMKQPVLVMYLLATFFGDGSEEDFDEEFGDEEANYLFLISNQIIMMLDEKVNGGKLKVVR